MLTFIPNYFLTKVPGSARTPVDTSRNPDVTYPARISNQRKGAIAEKIYCYPLCVGSAMPRLPKARTEQSTSLPVAPPSEENLKNQDLPHA